MLDPNEFDLERIRSSSQINQLVFHETLESTNDLALELARSNRLTLPALVIAKNQTAGRGQPGRRWLSSTGSLTFSVVVPIEKSASALLPLVVGLSACEAIEAIVSGQPTFRIDEPPFRMGLKWPNDLIVQQQKLGGILVETLASLNVAVIGIGMNVNNPLPDLTAESTTLVSPTSLTRELNTQIGLTDLVLGITKKTLMNCAAMTNPMRRSTIVAEINTRICCIGQTVNFQPLNGSAVSGILSGVADDGQLMLETKSGTELFHSGRLID